MKVFILQNETGDGVMRPVREVPDDTLYIVHGTPTTNLDAYSPMGGEGYVAMEGAE